MGTTLTGTTPQDTYDSLIKVTDNGPISGTAKYLSDGLGNDSALALSTTAAAIGTTTADSTLTVSSGTVNAVANFKSTDALAYIAISDNSSSGALNNYVAVVGDNMYFATNDTERVRINSSGNFFVGTTVLTDISSTGTGNEGAYIKSDGQIGLATSNDAVGIFNRKTNAGTLFDFRFNGASVGSINVSASGAAINLGGTAAANELDDYEEGTWTMGVSFGGASVGQAISVNTGTYTKIGRQVTAVGLIALSSKGSSTGAARITGLPFASNNYCSASLRFNKITFTNQFQGFVDAGQTFVVLEETTLLGVTTNLTNDDFANDSEIMISLTYFV